MGVSLRDLITQNLETMTTQELLEIKLDDSGQWSKAALDAAREILQERRRADLLSYLTAQSEVWEAYKNRMTDSAALSAPGIDKSKKVDTISRIWTLTKGLVVGRVKQYPSVRLGLTIAAGVFLGLLAMRVASRVFSYLEDQELLPTVAICAVITVLAVGIFMAFRRFRPHSRAGR